MLHLQGVVVCVAAGFLMHFMSQFYTQKVLQANEDDFPNMELVMEGFGNSFGMFLLSWIVTYTYI